MLPCVHEESSITPFSVLSWKLGSALSLLLRGHPGLDSTNIYHPQIGHRYHAGPTKAVKRNAKQVKTALSKVYQVGRCVPHYNLSFVVWCQSGKSKANLLSVTKI